MQQGGIIVNVGDNVQQGELVSTSGNSGLTSGPHLHFGVYRTSQLVEGDDLPINFRNLEGNLDSRNTLIMGQRYLALSY